MDKQSMLAFGAAAGLGVGYFLGRTQTSTTVTTISSSKAPVKKTTTAAEQQPLVRASEDEIERLIRPNILALTPYRCARDDYDQGTVRKAGLIVCVYSDT